LLFFSMDASDDDESQPPEPAGDAVDGNNLPQGAAGPPPGGAAAAPPAHPVWAAAAGRGSGANKQQRPESMYAPISMMELEIRGRNDLDGASSTASDRGGGRGRGRSSTQDGGRKRDKAKGKRPREYDDDEAERDDDDEEDARSAASLDIAGAAFGGGAKRACPPCASEASDDGASVTSSVVRARHERAFPVTGVTCVGCALPAKIQPVTDFIAKNMSTMSELALYKMAALVYKTKVAEPAEEEGVDVPNWDWKEVRAHYQLHSVDSRMQRYENIRTLSAMRKTLEMQLLKRDSETGEQWLDKNNAESIMKVIAASSRELTLLADASSTKKRG
jgi:hypothetical protein